MTFEAAFALHDLGRPTDQFFVDEMFSRGDPTAIKTAIDILKHGINPGSASIVLRKLLRLEGES